MAIKSAFTPYGRVYTGNCRITDVISEGYKSIIYLFYKTLLLEKYFDKRCTILCYKVYLIFIINLNSYTACVKQKYRIPANNLSRSIFKAHKISLSWREH